MASELGRGAQVRLDGEVRQLARGGNALRLIDNIREKLEMEESGTAPTGNTPDGSLGDGTAAEDEVLVPGGDASLITPTFTPTGTSAATRTVQSKLRDVRSVADASGATTTAQVNNATADLVAAGGGVLKFPGGAYTFTYTQPSTGAVWDFDGPDIRASTFGGDAGHYSTTARFGVIPGNHPTYSRSLHHIHAVSKGSGANGANHGDFALQLSLYKDDWTSPTAAPDGELDGLSVFVRNNAQPGTHLGDTAGLSMNVGAMTDSGFVCVEESVCSTFLPTTYAINYQIGTQECVINSRIGDYFGKIVYINTGAGVAAFRSQANGTASWARILENITTTGAANFIIDGSGNIMSTGLAARNYANDTAAAAAGVPLDGVYHTSGAVKIRLV